MSPLAWLGRSALEPRVNNMVQRLLIALLIPAALVVAAPRGQAQRVVKRIASECPMGYIDMGNGKCSALGLMTYTLRPAMGEDCPAGWMDVGGGYCRRD